MEKKWIDLALLNYDRWALLARPAIDQAVREGRTVEPSATFNELVGSLGLRLSLLPRIRRRIDGGWRSLSRAVQALDESYVSTPDKDGYAYPCDQETFLDLVLDIESLLFELGSCIDLIERLLSMTPEPRWLATGGGRRSKLKAVPGRKVGKRGRAEDHHKRIRFILAKNGTDIEWIDILITLRNVFIHEAAPYPRVEITTRGLELVFLRENVADSKERMTLRELCAMDRQFEKSKDQIQKHLIGIYEKCK